MAKIRSTIVKRNKKMPESQEQAAVQENKPKNSHVQWINGYKYGLSQVYNNGLEYCFISDDNTQISPYVFCKDFLHDLIMAYYTNAQASVYGFVYDPKTSKPPCLNKIKLSLVNSKDPNFSDKIPALIDFINQIEEILKLKKSTAYLVDNPLDKYKNGTWIVEGSSKWQIAPPMLSLYALMLRCGFTHKIGETYKQTIDKLIDGTYLPYQSNDRSQLSGAIPGLEYVLQHGYAKIFYKDPKDNYKLIPIHTMHNNMGIVSFSGKLKSQSVTKDNKEDFYYWYKPVDEKKPPLTPEERAAKEIARAARKEEKAKAKAAAKAAKLAAKAEAKAKAKLGSGIAIAENQS